MLLEAEHRRSTQKISTYFSRAQIVEKIIGLSSTLHHKLHNLEKIFKKFKMSKNLNDSIDFGKIQYQRSLIDILYLCAILGR